MTTAVHELLTRLKDEPRRIVFPFQLPGRNEWDAAALKSRDRFAELRAKVLHDCRLFAARYRRVWEPSRGKVIIACNWREPNRHRDPDNIIGGGRKPILDALGPGRKGARGWEGAGVLHCDGWHCIAGFFDIVTHDVETPGVEVVIADVQMEMPLSKSARHVVIDVREARP